eukprot:1185309-Prorocentrum_minimum.AAC.5
MPCKPRVNPAARDQARDSNPKQGRRHLNNVPVGAYCSPRPDWCATRRSKRNTGRSSFDSICLAVAFARSFAASPHRNPLGASAFPGTKLPRFNRRRLRQIETLYRLVCSFVRLFVCSFGSSGALVQQVGCTQQPGDLSPFQKSKPGVELPCKVMRTERERGG